MATKADEETHFGDRRRAAGREAGAGRRRVPFGRAALRPDERPDVGRPAPRLEGRAGHRASTPPQNRTEPFALLDLAGGTGDVAFRVVEAGGAGTRVTVCDINAEMLGVGARTRHAARARRRRHLRAGQCRGTAVSGQELRLRHDRLRHPQRAAHRARAGRGVSRAASSAGVSSAWNFPASTCRGSTRSTSFIPSRSSRASARRSPATARPINIWSSSIRKFPSRRAFAEMIEAAGFRRVSFTRDDRRRRGAAFGLEIVIAGLLPSHPSRARRFRVRARGRVRAGRPRPLPLPARIGIALARLIERPGGERRLRPARRRADQARADLRQARPVHGDAARRGRQADRARSGKPAGQDGAVSAERSRSRGRRSLRQAAQRRLRRASGPRSPPPRSRRCTAPRSRQSGERKAGRGENPAARHRAPLQGRSRRVLLCCAQGRKPVAGSAAAAPDRSGRDAGALGRDRNGFPPRGRGALRDGREHAQGRRISACRRSTGTAPRARC